MPLMEQSNDTLELSLQPAIFRLWERREMFSDLTLKSADGKTIPVHKSILAARSPVFERLFYGDFSESKKSELDLGYPGYVLQEIVQYCYTDQSPLLKNTFKSSDVQLAQSFMELHLAADYFGIPKLCSNISNLIVSQIQVDPTLSWLFLGVDYYDAIVQQTARNAIRKRFLKTIAKGIPSIVDLSLIKTFLADSNVMIEEINKFRLIQLWLSNSLEDDDKRLTPCNRDEDLRSIASQLVKTYVDLDRILPGDLEKVVEPSELVQQSKIIKSYKQCALAAQHQSPCITSQLKIVVSGASPISVNGAYRYNGVYDTVASFSKTGSWNGHVEIFLLFCCRLSDETERWYISIAPKDLNPSNSEDTNLYYSNTAGDLSELPDKLISVVENGIEPLKPTGDLSELPDTDKWMHVMENGIELINESQYAVDTVKISMFKEISPLPPSMQNYKENFTKTSVWSYLASMQHQLYHQSHSPKLATYGPYSEIRTTNTEDTEPEPYCVYVILLVQASLLIWVVVTALLE